MTPRPAGRPFLIATLIATDHHGGQSPNPLMRDVVDYVTVLEHGGSESGG